MPSLAIVGGGVAGLAAACYARMNGYDTTVYEMHDLPGGLCTGWTRRGYTIDGCVHWLVGSASGEMHRVWREVGVVPACRFVDCDTYVRFEYPEGPPISIHADADRLERHLLEVAPGDAAAIRDTMATVRRLAGFPTAMAKAEELMGPLDKVRMLASIATRLPAVVRTMRVSIAGYAQRFSDPRLRDAMTRLFVPEMPALFGLMTLAWLHERNSGYPVGGSLGLARAMEARVLALGGTIRYRSRVERILVEGGRAAGVRLADGTEARADAVVSAADMHATVFDLLEGRFADAEVRGRFERMRPFTPLVLVGLGLRRAFPEYASIVAGASLPLAPPLEVAGGRVDRIGFRPIAHDPTLAPPGCTSAAVVFESPYAWWADLRERDREAYRREKARVGEAVVAALDRRFPGLAADVEVVDVATPATFRRYTDNWQGSFEGFLATPETGLKGLPKTLPGLDRFWQAGHWVQPGGGLPPAALSGRDAVQLLCARDGRTFRTAVG